jgi:hypothetical protein
MADINKDPLLRGYFELYKLAFLKESFEFRNNGPWRTATAYAHGQIALLEAGYQDGLERNAKQYAAARYARNSGAWPRKRRSHICKTVLVDGVRTKLERS